MIFISSLPNIESIIDLERVSPMEAPLNVSHVCRSWRNIALATPALWTRLWFVKQQEENWTISATEAVFSLFHTFLERSAHCGLHIRLFIPFDKSQQGDLEYLVGMTDAIVAVQHRWEVASITTSSTVWSRGFINNRNWSLNKLTRVRELSFDLDRVRPGEDPEVVVHPFDLDVSGAVDMVKLSLLDGSRFAMQLRVNEGTCLPKLKLLGVKGGSNLENTFKLLRCTSSLEELRLEVPEVRADGRVRSMCRIPSLRTFRLDLMHADNTQSLHQSQNVLRHLELPSLQDLKLRFLLRIMDQIFSEVVEMLRRSDAQLKTLHLTPGSLPMIIEQGSYLRLFDALQSLETFIDKASFNPSNLFRSLTVKPNKPAPLPNLRTLGLYGLIGGEDFDELGACLLSRSPLDGESYPPLVLGEDTNTAGRAEVSERRSWTGTSILRKLIIINWAGDYFIKTEDLLENAVIADLYMRGLLIDFD